MIHRAMDLAAPGDVIVVDGGGDLTNALIGELMPAYAIGRGIAGFVLDGAIRDLGAIRPRASRSMPPESPSRALQGWSRGDQLPIAVDGMVVSPGDIIIGDEDGFLSIPRAAAERSRPRRQKSSPPRIKGARPSRRAG